MPSALGPVSITLIGSLLIAVVLLAIRVFVLQRVQTRRQRENRQETERLKFLVAAYRSLAGSFTPASDEHRGQIEETLADVVLFGALPQVELAADCARRLVQGETVDYQPLIESLRTELRGQLGLDPLPAHVTLPPAGPARSPRGRGDGEGGRGEGRGGGGGGGAGGGMGGGGGMVAGGVGIGVVASESAGRDV